MKTKVIFEISMKFCIGRAQNPSIRLFHVAWPKTAWVRPPAVYKEQILRQVELIEKLINRLNTVYYLRNNFIRKSVEILGQIGDIVMFIAEK